MCLIDKVDTGSKRSDCLNWKAIGHTDFNCHADQLWRGPSLQAF